MDGFSKTAASAETIDDLTPRARASCPGTPIVLIADQDTQARRRFAQLVSRHAIVRTAANLAGARRLLDDYPLAALIMDVDLEDGCGIPLLAERPPARRSILVLSATHDVLRISRACTLGAKFVSKREPDAVVRSQVLAFVERARHRQLTSESAIAQVAQLAGLTRAELDTLRLFVHTGDRSSLGLKLGIAETSVRSRVRGVCRKLGIPHLSDAYRLLLEQMLTAG